MTGLLARIRAAGFPAVSLSPAPGGVVATAGLATLADGTQIFAKTVAGAPVFPAEAEGLHALRDAGAVRVPQVLAVHDDLLVLERLLPPPDGEIFWETLGRALATLHTTTVSGRFGWHRDGWLGRLTQENPWHTDGHTFFAEHRILRWLREPLVDNALDASDRRALERLCAGLTDLIPARPAVLTHGDLWSGNILADAAGQPALIDPAVSYTWAETDLSMLWCTPRPAASRRCFDVYTDLAGLADGWQARMPILHLRELLSTIAHDDDDWGAAAEVRRIIDPFRRR